jgi:hypothetical protein
MAIVKTVDITATSLHSVEKVVKALGGVIVFKQATPGAVGYIRITIERNAS